MAEDLTLEAAEKIIAAAKKKAAQLKTRMDIAVVDAGGNLKAFERMDGAWLGSIDISIRKARTARFFDMDTGDLGKLSKPGAPAYMIEVSNGGLISFPGGAAEDCEGRHRWSGWSEWRSPQAGPGCGRRRRGRVRKAIPSSSRVRSSAMGKLDRPG